MMALNELFSAIEDVKFGLQLSAASGFSVVKIVLENDSALQKLMAEIKNSPENRAKVFKRLLALLEDNDEPEYMHEHDEALTAYLFVLSKTDENFVRLAMDKILRTPNLWWSRRLAEELQHTMTEKSGTD